MTPVSVRATVTTLVRALTLAVCFAAGLVHADEYSDVSQMISADRLADALAKVESHLKKKPRDPQMRYFKGMIEQKSGHTEDALATFTKLTEDFPELPEPFNALAVIYAAQGDYERARLALEKAIRANPAYATAHENLGDIYARLASRAYCKAIELDGGNASARAKLDRIGGNCQP